MDYSKVALVVCVTVVIVIGINAAIYAAYGKGGSTGTVEMFRQAAKRARDPWGQVESDLEELSRRVTELSDKREEDTNSK